MIKFSKIKKKLFNLSNVNNWLNNSFIWASRGPLDGNNEILSSSFSNLSNPVPNSVPLNSDKAPSNICSAISWKFYDDNQ